MERGAWFLERDGFGVWTVVVLRIVLALARCGRCRRRMRVLPSDLLPHKRYALSVIEHLVAEYAEGTKGLGRVVWGLAGERTPAPSTLHAWTEGLGAHALGHPGGEVKGATPASALIAESRGREERVDQVPVPAVNPRRYRSEGRHDRLARGTWLLALALLVTGEAVPFALSTWCALAPSYGLRAPLRFPTGLGDTPLERVEAGPRARSPP